MERKDRLPLIVPAALCFAIALYFTFHGMLSVFGLGQSHWGVSLVSFVAFTAAAIALVLIAPSRFPIYAALRAISWAGLTALAWANAGTQWSLASRGLADPFAQWFALAVGAFSIVGPFVSIASLFWRTWIGFVIGGVVLLLAIPVYMVLNC